VVQGVVLVVLGILGGIGSGKSAIAGLFTEAGAELVDADRLAREVLGKPEARARVAAAFGPDVLGPDGQVDRKALADRVFTDPKALEALNAIVHPEVRERIRERILLHRRGRDGGAGPGSVLVLDVPLLAGSPLQAECDGWVYVEAPAALRQARIRARGWAQGEMERREVFQAPLERKKELAQWIVDNSGTLEDSRAQVRRILGEIAGTGPTAH